MSKPILDLIGISKNFISGEDSLAILKKVDLQIISGNTIAITGASGSGKSTLLGIMAGLERPSAGELIFSGEAIHNWNEDKLSAWRRQKVGFIFQNFRLMKKLTAKENVALPMEILGHSTKEAYKRANELLTQLEVDKRKDHFPHQLSGGEQQRVAIARAYAHCPQIIFADEPTGSLDTQTAIKVLQSLLDINQQTSTSLVVVTHDMQVAQKMQNQYKLIEGQLVNGS